ncbi:PH domain-containing protein [Mycolicibacterium thermoresistibile]
MSKARWDLEVRPRLTPRYAYGAAVVIFAVHVVLAILLPVKPTGVIYQTADQVAFVLLGVVFAGAILLFTRPRLRVGPPGVAVRNLFGYRVIPWDDVIDVSLHPGARWARVDLPDDEYLPAMAIQLVDKHHAADAMERVHERIVHYKAQTKSAN